MAIRAKGYEGLKELNVFDNPLSVSWFDTERGKSYDNLNARLQMRGFFLNLF